MSSHRVFQLSKCNVCIPIACKYLINCKFILNLSYRLVFKLGIFLDTFTYLDVFRLTIMLNYAFLSWIFVANICFFCTPKFQAINSLHTKASTIKIGRVVWVNGFLNDDDKHLFIITPSINICICIYKMCRITHVKNNLSNQTICKNKLHINALTHSIPIEWFLVLNQYKFKFTCSIMSETRSMSKKICSTMASRLTTDIRHLNNLMFIPSES